MQIVIDIPDRLIDNELGYTDIRLHKDRKHINSITTEDYESPYFAYLSFVVLPEHHGRLIDADELKKIIKENDILTMTGFSVRLCDIDDAPTVIEAIEEVD